MICLTTTNDVVQVVLGGAVAANQLQVYACWRVIKPTPSPEYTPTKLRSVTNDTTDVSIVTAPASGKQHVVDNITIFNADTAAATVTVKIDESGAETILRTVALNPGEVLEYTESHGWRVFDAYGRPRLGVQYSAPLTAVLTGPIRGTANLTGVKTITSASSFAVYMGKALRTNPTMTLRFRVTTAAVTITWAEVAIARGSVNVGGNPTLTVLGFTDVSGIINSTGQKSVVVAPASGQTVHEGDDLWAIIGNQASTAAIVRAYGMADDLQTGFQASLATRPSLNVGATQAYTIEGATTLRAMLDLVLV